MALLHEGQADGRRVRVPVTLGRRPDEPLDADLRAWYDRLLGAIDDGMRRGRWSLAAVEGWPDNRSFERLVAWTWTAADQRHLVVVNLSDERADGMVRWPDLPAGPLRLVDLLDDETFERDGTGIAADGLYVRARRLGRHHPARLTRSSTRPRPFRQLLYQNVKFRRSGTRVGSDDWNRRRRRGRPRQGAGATTRT